MSALNPLIIYCSAWCVWTFGDERQNGKRAKMPINPKTGQRARVSDPDTFANFETAQWRMNKGGSEGFGVLLDDSGLVCVDLDNVIDDAGRVSDEGQRIVDLLDSFTEISASGRGLHIFIKATKPTARSRVGNVEIYERGRFIAVTGNLYEGRGQINDRQRELDDLCQEVFGEDTDDTGEESDMPRLADEEIRKRLRVKNRRGILTSLMKGEWADLVDADGKARYPSHSEADMALLAAIAEYTSDADQIDRIFRQTGLVRDKWLNRRDYRKRSIDAALHAAEARMAADGQKHQQAQGAEVKQTLARKLSGSLDQLIFSGNKLAPVPANVAILLVQSPNTAGRFGYDDFAGQIQKLAPIPEIFGDRFDPRVGDADVTALRAWLAREFHLFLQPRDVFEGLSLAARTCRYDPVVDKLESLVWDGVPRLDNWLSRYLGAQEVGSGDYSREVGRRFLISAVARAFAPGCKADHVLVLQGRQGAYKSTSIKVLAEAIAENVFSETLAPLSSPREAALSLTGVWIMEISELSAFGRAEAEGIKSFLSTCTDRVRRPYGLLYEYVPRRCVFVATTNADVFIRDDTGGRRFWPVKVGVIDLEALERDASQLWAEAVQAYKAGEQWYISDPKTLAQAQAEQLRCQDVDAWDNQIAAWADNPGVAGECFSLLDVWKEVFKGSAADLGMTEQKRLVGSLKRLGFERKHQNSGNVWLAPGLAGVVPFSGTKARAKA